MVDLSRRCFLSLSAAAIPLFAAEPYDLVITGGRVFDPARKVDGVMDVAVRGESIAAVGPGLAAGAKRTIDARGSIVTPGLIDMHGHVYDEGIPTSIDPDLIGIPRGVTTIVDAGSSGAFTFPGFRKYVIARARTRVRALINISSIGLVVQNEMYIDPKLIDGKTTTKMIQDNPGLILGIKVRIRGRDEEVDHDAGVLAVARDVSDATGVPIMMHWSNNTRLLGMLRKGDILTHPYNPPRSGPSLLGPGRQGSSADSGTEGPRHLHRFRARRASSLGDCGESGRQWLVPRHHLHRYLPRPCRPQRQCAGSCHHAGEVSLSGHAARKSFGSCDCGAGARTEVREKIGTLEPGAVADISVLRMEDASFELRDSTRQPRTGKRRVVPQVWCVQGFTQLA